MRNKESGHAGSVASVPDHQSPQAAVSKGGAKPQEAKKSNGTREQKKDQKKEHGAESGK
jgi:hypothetical protein